MQIFEQYMRRAIQLAENGRGFVAPNPMVGAVIVAPDGRIIGEGWHRRYGSGHAEVNAVASVLPADRHLLEKSTIYVTLEPCSHFGKTPPCAQLIIDNKIPHVVVGAGDPNEKVNGRGIALLREAGIEVVTGILADESQCLNHVFFTAHTQSRPFITLKLAQSVDGFMDSDRIPGKESPFRFSNPLTGISTMKLRSESEAIITTAATVNVDHSRLTVRDWDGLQPRRLLLGQPDSRGPLSQTTGFQTFCRQNTADLSDFMHRLYREEHLTSVLVEAGPRFLSKLLDTGLWDALRVEISPVRLGEKGTHPAPSLPTANKIVSETDVAGNRLIWYSNNLLFNKIS